MASIIHRLRCSQAPSSPVRTIFRLSLSPNGTRQLSSFKRSAKTSLLPSKLSVLYSNSADSTVANSRYAVLSRHSSGPARRLPFAKVANVRYNSTQPDKEISTPAPKPTTTTSAILQRLNPTPHENIYTLPNILTFTRLLAAPAVGYFILHSQPLAALTLFFYAGITDAVDGYLARRYNSQTVVGTVIDPMADKALMTIAVIALGMQGFIPVWLAVIILGRDVGLAISAIYFRWISLPPPKTMARYWDFSLPSAEVHPTEVSKINTLLQLLLVGNAMLLPVLPEALVADWNLTGVFEGWQYLVASTTVWSGLSYIWNKDAVTILTPEEIERRRTGGLPKKPIEKAEKDV